MMKFIDLSVTLEWTSSEPEPVEIEYITHEEGAEILGAPVGLSREDFPDGLGLSLERIKITSHSGTHLDATLHYGPISEGKPAKSIEDIPLEWCYSDGVVIRVDPNLEYPVTLEEVVTFLEKIGYQIKPLDIVLIQTKADLLWGTPEYFTTFRGVSVEATQWLVDQGVKIIGVDSFGFDPLFHRMLSEYRLTADKKALWPAHCYGRQREYCQIERLANLQAIPCESGFKVSCFPIKIHQAGAGWTRVVAMIEGENH